MCKEIGKFYQNKKQWNKTIGYIEKAMLKIRRRILKQIYFCFKHIQRQKFEKAAKKSHGYGGCFPAQPQFYYSGLAYNQLAQFKKQKKCWKWDWIIW
jgi:hypothetical protein